MKQTSTTEAERSAGPDSESVGADRADSGGADAGAAKGNGKIREGDKPVGESSTGGSSPSEEPHHVSEQQRSR